MGRQWGRVVARRGRRGRALASVLSCCCCCCTRTRRRRLHRRRCGLMRSYAALNGWCDVRRGGPSIASTSKDFTKVQLYRFKSKKTARATVLFAVALKRQSINNIQISTKMHSNSRAMGLSLAQCHHYLEVKLGNKPSCH